VNELTTEQVELLKACGSANPKEALPAQAEFTKAVAEETYKAGVLDGDIVSGVYETQQLAEEQSAEYLLDLLQPGSERDYIAYYLPDTGHVPERTVGMNKVMVPTISTGNSINCPLKFLRQGRVDILGRMLEVLEAGFVMRDNLDGFTVILRALSANATVAASTSAGVMSLAGTSAVKLKVRRQGGGNASSVNRWRATDMFISPEAGEDLRTQTHDQADDNTRRILITAPDFDGFTWQGVTFHVVDELGEGQLFQKVWTNTLGKAMTGSNREIGIALDLSPNGRRQLKNPRKRGLEIYEDPVLHRRQEFGWYAWKERGWAVMTSKCGVVFEI
jgi:surface antigen